MLKNNQGFTLIELMLSLVVLLIIVIAFFNLYISVVHSSIVASREAEALTLATNQMEYYQTVPYQNLAVQNGPIVANSYLPASVDKTINGHTYIIKTEIVYVDDAYNGCGSYPSLQLEEEYCRNYPPPQGAPNPGDAEDYKDIRVVVTDSSNLILAKLDTQIAPPVSGVINNSGNIIVKVIDNNGNPIVGAKVHVVNSSVSPSVNAYETTDQNGIAVFYGMPPDRKFDYTVSASYSGYSSLSTIANFGNLVPVYPNQDLLQQNSDYVTLTLRPMGQYSLVINTTDINGSPIGNATIAIKGGYKEYTSSTNYDYYYNSQVAPNVSPVTNSSGYVGLQNLVPGNYYFCGTSGNKGCSVGGTNYYLVAAVAYSGNNSFYPVVVPTFLSSTYTGPYFPYQGNDYLQEVRLILTSNPAFPRIDTLTPSTVSETSSSLSDFSFNLTGTNLPCGNSASSCQTQISFIQNTNSFKAQCTGTGNGTNLNCQVNLTGVITGNTQLEVQTQGYTLKLPAAPLLGGIIVSS